MPNKRNHSPRHAFPHHPRSPKRGIFASGLALTGLVLLLWGALAGVAFQSVAQADSNGAVSQCNSQLNADAKLVQCTVTVTNNLNIATGKTSSTVTVKSCNGAPGAAPNCTVKTTSFTPLQTSVNQCNGSGNAGGSTVRCTVKVINNITGKASTSPASVNQCNGSGTGGGTQPTVNCNPSDANTTNATIDQCNGSGNGGGAARRVTCTVTTSTKAAALPVTINQCNGSGNGGGATVICTASITNNILPAVPTTTPPVTTPPVTTPPATTPPVTAPPVTKPPVTTPPVTAPPVTSRPVSKPPVTSRPVSKPPVTTPPVTAPPVTRPASSRTAVTTSRAAEATSSTRSRSTSPSTSPRSNAPTSSNSPSFVAPAGLTGDTPTRHGANPLLVLLGISFLAASMLVIVRRSAR